MENQLRGIALILIGIQLAFFSTLDLWLPILGGHIERVLLVLSLVVSVIGLWLCFKRKKDN